MRDIRLRSTEKQQRGFTIIELLVALAITAAIISGVAVAIYQMFSINASASNRMLAINQVQNIGLYISKDAQMARIITLGDDPATTGVTEFVTLDWNDWDNKEYKAVYTLDDSKMLRSYSIIVDGSVVETVETLVAENIETAATDCYLDADGQLIVQATATVGGFRQVSETRIYEIVSRTSA